MLRNLGPGVATYCRFNKSLKHNEICFYFKIPLIQNDHTLADFSPDSCILQAIINVCFSFKLGEFLFK